MTAPPKDPNLSGVVQKRIVSEGVGAADKPDAHADKQDCSAEHQAHFSFAKGNLTEGTVMGRSLMPEVTST
jgi:hypothetical protein